MSSDSVDVAIIGGGPGGATTAALLKTHRPELSVAVFEREIFPREHVGESQLPPIGDILAEMGCWDRVEAANFPIKIGATYRWGHSPKLWDFEFVPMEAYREEARPRARTEQSRQLAFQVDRAIYDQILLDRARELGCQIHQPAAVRQVLTDGRRVEALQLQDGRQIRARHYVDASGNAAILRRAFDVPIDLPTKLQNVAFWDYWENTEWASRFPGGATRVLVLSIGIGWIWFIPLGPTRTSIGLICPASYYKSQSRSAADLYAWALQQEPLIAELTAGASRENEVRATRDWSFLAQQWYGDNWMLVGESGGFADPILAAGLTLTHTGAREAAYTLLALDDAVHDRAWLLDNYQRTQSARIRQHMRFADFWYSANGIFTDLQDYTREIARDAGMEMSAQRAFQWLATGGFTNDILGQPGIGGLDLAGARQVAMRMVDGQQAWQLSKYNHFRLNLRNAKVEMIPVYEDGQIRAVRSHVRGQRRLVEHGYFAQLLTLLRHEHDLTRLLDQLRAHLFAEGNGYVDDRRLQFLLQSLEVMVTDGWVEAKLNPKRPRLELGTPFEGRLIHTNEPLNARIGALSASGS
ncbi:MAG: tryptophan 7-halogenase [Xanthomonadales bacterium]|nr:tryptophan 7-halogenase [Xanthomonadales bacterium]